MATFSSIPVAAKTGERRQWVFAYGRRRQPQEAAQRRRGFQGSYVEGQSVARRTGPDVLEDVCQSASGPPRSGLPALLLGLPMKIL